MSARSFFNTNVLVYADDKAAPAKQKRAVDLVAEYRRARTGVVSRQVLEEYFVTVTRRLGVDPSTARRKGELLAEFDVVVPEFPDILARSTCTVFTDFLLGRYGSTGSQTGWMRGTFLSRYASSSGGRWGANFESVPVGFSLRVTRHSLLFVHARHLHPVRAHRVARNAPVQRLRDLLAVAVVAQLLFIGRTADERNFRQDRWH